MNDTEIYGLDSVALLSYFANTLGRQGDDLFTKAESNEIKLIVPSIVIGESIYTILKKRNIFGTGIPQEKINYILELLYQSPIFIITDLTRDGWIYFIKSKIKGFHDRMIVATCLQAEVQWLITKDPEIIESNEINTVW